MSYIEYKIFDPFPSGNNSRGFKEKSKRNNLRRISGSTLYKGVIMSTLDRQIIGTTSLDDVYLFGASNHNYLLFSSDSFGSNGGDSDH